MNLDDLVFSIIDPLPSKEAAQSAQPIEGEVVDDDVCQMCGVEGSTCLPSGTCDVCGAAWLDDPDDFQTALDLLQTSLTLIQPLMANKKIVKKLGVQQEAQLRDLMMSLDDFLEDYIDDAGASIE